MSPAVFFDRDNTLIVNDAYLTDPNGVVLMEGAADLVAKVRKLGFKVVVVSNQGGVARGQLSEADVKAVNRAVEAQLLRANRDAAVDGQEYCAFHPQGTVPEYARESDLRKPAPGMIFKAAAALKIDLSSSWLVGDTPRDIEAGNAAGLRTIFFTHPGIAPSPSTAEQGRVAPDFTVASLQSAGDVIAAHAGAPSVEGHLARIERRLEQVQTEIKRRHEAHVHDLPVAKILAGILQVLVLGTLLLAYINISGKDIDRAHLLIAAGVGQLMVVSLMLAGRRI